MRLRAARAYPRIPLPFPRRFPRCVSIIQEAAGNCKHFHHFSIQKIGHFQIKSVFFEQQTAVPVIHAKPPKKCGCNGFVTFLFPFFNPIGCDFRISPSFPNSVFPAPTAGFLSKKIYNSGQVFSCQKGRDRSGRPLPRRSGDKSFARLFKGPPAVLFSSAPAFRGGGGPGARPPPPHPQARNPQREEELSRAPPRRRKAPASPHACARGGRGKMPAAAPHIRRPAPPQRLPGDGCSRPKTNR